MSQASFFTVDQAPEGAERVQVLAPYPLSRAYDYFLPEGMAAGPGDYVRIPLGRRETPGVVWAAGEAEGEKIDPKKIKPVLQRYDFPPMPQAQREFLEWVARYTMADLGSVLKMSLSVPDALSPPKEATAYTVPPEIHGAAAPFKLTAARQRVIDFLKDGVPRRAADIAREAGCGAGLVRSMATAGQLKAIAVSAPAPCRVVDLSHGVVSFSGEQQVAANALRGFAEKQEYAGVLLDGVTGAGKTEVYFEAVAETLRQGKQALVLLPEISLSAPFLERFEKRFGSAPALWHSEVPAAQRRVTWTGVAAGDTKVVIGARSALFLPFADLGLIVVDEEHDASYKQEEGVMYNARDMAVVRANLGNFPVVLVSATPSLETMVNVEQGKYSYLRLPSRHAGAQLPEMNVVNLKQFPPGRNRFISPPLEKALRETFHAAEQSLLFLNRRGYAPLTLCRTCGHRFQCPSCSAWLVEHRRHNRLQCHHCGYAQKVPTACPECNDADSLAACGPGVERIQEEVHALLPDARTFILASDVAGSPTAIRTAVRDIEEGKYDVIIGTQIIAKGHHFPSLTCVGVVDADLGLAGGDLRAGERTFQLLHQVAGRAGRAQKPGRVFLQTYMPEQSVIRALAASDRDAFLAAESAERERAGMPPFGRLAALILSGPDDVKLDVFCRSLAQSAPRYDDITVLGPAPAPMAFLRGKHRRRFLVKAGRNLPLQKYLAEWLGMVKVPSALQLKIDIDPQSFF
ncbi:MAG: primosomal protein N' [Alphaproteobacteria bacterium]|nr:primosomal protein N' [Alphaproteobacteria bacterium]